MALTTIAQIEAVLGRPLTPAEETRATELIPMVSDAIIEELGRDPVAGTHTEVVKATNVGLYIVPHFPLASIDDLETVDGDPIDTADLVDVYLPGGVFTLDRRPLHRLVVTYTTKTIGALGLLAAQIVARSTKAGTEAAAVPSFMAGLRQLTIGRWSGIRESSAIADPVASLNLGESDLATIDAWRDRRS